MYTTKLGYLRIGHMLNVNSPCDGGDDQQQLMDAHTSINIFAGRTSKGSSFQERSICLHMHTRRRRGINFSSLPPHYRSQRDMRRQ